MTALAVDSIQGF